MDKPENLENAPGTKPEYRTVQFKLLLDTYVKVGELAEMLKSANRADAVARAIDIAVIVVRCIKAGGDVILVHDNERRDRLIVEGL